MGRSTHSGLPEERFHLKAQDLLTMMLTLIPVENQARVLEENYRQHGTKKMVTNLGTSFHNKLRSQ